MLAPVFNRARAYVSLFAIGVFTVAVLFVWFVGSHNPYTPAGYVGYLTKGAVLGQSRYYGIQRGPTSPGRTWMLDVTNVSVTPYTYTEEFIGTDAVMSRDNLKIGFRVHTVWHVDDSRCRFMERFSTTVRMRPSGSDAVVKMATRTVREPLWTFASTRCSAATDWKSRMR